MSSAGSVLEMFCVVSVASNQDSNEPKSEWIKVSVCSFDATNGRVLVKKSNDHSMQYAAIDSATLRLPESESGHMNDENILCKSATKNESAAAAAASSSSSASSINNIQFNNISNHNTMNFNGIPSIPHISNGILPPFDALAANNISSQHHISNTINTNNNISINGNVACDPIVI